MTESGYCRPPSGVKQTLAQRPGSASPLCSATVTMRSRELEGVVLFRGQIGLGYRQAGRVN